jgi:hypothetical protein
MAAMGDLMMVTIMMMVTLNSVAAVWWLLS